jgi:lipoprotein-anchoring transpeptidase ErfK/SrfK
VAGVASTLALSSCGLTQLTLASQAVSAAESAAQIQVQPTLGSKDVNPSTPIKVNVNSGRLTSVKVTSADGRRLPGKVSLDAHSWVSDTSSLGYGQTYRVAVTAVDREGLVTTTRKTFRTIVPDELARTYVEPVEGTVVGVGMPITVQFNHKVENKADVEKRMQVLTPTPVAGAWSWIDSKMVQYRPRTYWPANTAITVKVPTVGTQLAPGVWGGKDRSVTFRTGDALVSYVNMRTDQMQVTKNGKTIRTIPITTGKPGFETRSGVKVIMGKERSRIMDASTGGTSKNDPEYYRLKVEYAMRVTWSGEFLHAAPWSEGSQGSANVSHGCTGMSTGNAAWLYGISRPGDVVSYTGNSKMMTTDNGIGVWNVSWSKWMAGSALAATPSA